MLKNFITTITRFRTSTILNLMGLTAAFVTFMIITLQVNVEHGYDKMYNDSDRMYVVQKEWSWDKGQWGSNFSRPDIDLIKNLSPQIEELSFRRFSSSALGGTTFKFDGSELGNSESVAFNMGVSAISGSFLEMFNVEIVEGVLDQNDPSWVIIPQSIAQKYPNGESVIGKTITIIDGFSGVSSKKTFMVSGVYKDLPVNSSFPNEVFVNAAEIEVGNKRNNNFSLFLKLKSEQSKPEIEQSIHTLFEQISIQEQEELEGYRLMPIQELYFSSDSEPGEKLPGNRSKTNLFTMMAILVMLIAAINYINFATALIPARVKGINTRKVYGATNLSIRLQMIFEAVGISLIAYIIATLILLGFKTLDNISFIDTPIVITDHLNILFSTSILALLIGVGAGVYPAFYSTSFKTAYVLKGSFGLSPKGKMLRSTLVGFQYIVSIGLIIAALFMNIQYELLRNKEMGFERENILHVKLSDKVAKTQETLLNEISKNPDVIDITVSAFPFFSETYQTWSGMGDERTSKLSFQNLRVKSNFTKLFGIKIIEGEDFSEADDTKNGDQSVIINRTTQKLFGFNVGDSIRQGRIIGIMEDFNFKPLREDIESFGLLNMGYRSYGGFTNLYLKCQSNDYPGLIENIRTIGKTIDPDWSADISFLDKKIEELYQNEARATRQISLFSLLTIIISLIGVFGLIHFELGYRRKEIALRKINGATASLILTMFNRKFVMIVVFCYLIAGPIAWYAVNEWLKGFAYRTQMAWWVFVIALIIVLLITIFTVTIQSWRASNENPIQSLRSE